MVLLVVFKLILFTLGLLCLYRLSQIDVTAAERQQGTLARYENRNFYTGDYTFSPVIDKSLDCGIAEMIECTVNDSLACLACMQLNAVCVHFERDFHLTLNAGKEAVTIRANKDSNRGYCVKGSRKRKCNPVTGEWTLFENDLKSKTLMWMCTCKYPNLVTQINLFSDCDINIACGKHGSFDRNDIDPLLRTCKCNAPYVSAFDNIRGPYCRLPRVFEMTSDVPYLPNQSVIPVHVTDPAFVEQVAHPHLLNVPDPCRFAFVGFEPAKGCLANDPGTVGVHIWPHYLAVQDDFGACNFAMKRKHSALEGYLFYSHPKQYDKIIPIYLTDINDLKHLSWATTERLKAMWQFQIEYGTPPTSRTSFNDNRSIYIMSAYIDPPIRINSSLLPYHYEQSRWFLATPNREYNCGIYRRYGAGYIDSPYPIKPCMGQHADGPLYPLLSPCRLVIIGDYEANRCSQSACYWHNFIWPSNDKKYTQNYWGYPSLMFSVAKDELRHGEWKAKLFDSVYPDQSDFKRVFYHEGRRIVFHPMDPDENHAITSPRKLQRKSRDVPENEGICYLSHPSGNGPIYKFVSTSLKFHMHYDNDNLFIRRDVITTQKIK